MLDVITGWLLLILLGSGVVFWIHFILNSWRKERDRRYQNNRFNGQGDNFYRYNQSQQPNNNSYNQSQNWQNFQTRQPYYQNTGNYGPTYYPYAQSPLLTNAEYNFYRVLKAKCDERGFLICPKVRLEDFINVTTNQQVLKYRGYIKSRHVDFLLCDRNLRIVAGLELDDNSHHTQDAWKVDNFKNNLFEVIRLPLFRVRATYGSYDNTVNEILNIICFGVPRPNMNPQGFQQSVRNF